MTTKSILLGLTAESAIHAGASSANHIIDLPIMREHSTNWPVIFGSAVKGALRAKAEITQIEKELCFTLFGPDTNNASDHAGSLLIGDARLLLLPMRSLTSQFRYVTSPDLLARWQRDCQRAGIDVEFTIPSPNDNTVVTHNSFTQNRLFLEEYIYETDSSADIDALINALAKISGRNQEEIARKITIVNDDQFTRLCNAAIPVNAHIAIDSATKTVKRGALWYAESLPTETVLYTLISAQQSRNKRLQKSASELLELFGESLFNDHPYLQVGGNETTGMGWCKVQIQEGA